MIIAHILWKILVFTGSAISFLANNNNGIKGAEII